MIIDNWKLKIGGYTLLELMIATAVVGVLAIVATSLFFSVSRGGTKVQVTAEVNQNGEIVLGTMERLIRNAFLVTSCPVTEAASLSLVDRYGRDIILSCENVGADNGYIASNSARLTSENVAVAACSFSCTEDQAGFRPPLVEIDFTLRQAQGEAGKGETSQQQFKTSVSLRNY